MFVKHIHLSTKTQKENKTFHITLTILTLFTNIDMNILYSVQSECMQFSMEQQERDIIQDLLNDLTRDIIASDMLPYLICLTQDDKEYILMEERNYGYRRAAILLIDRIQRRRNGFQQLLQALIKTGCRHLVELIQQRSRENGM